MKTRAILFTTLVASSLMLGLATTTQAATADNRGVVHDMYAQMVRNTFGNCVRTRWTSANDECRQIAEVKKAERRELAAEARTVYFEFNKARLLESERRKLNSLAGELKSMDDISGVSIAGYADRIGTTNYNERLSKERAGVVEQHLRRRGYLNTTVAKTLWLGESEPVTQCADNLGRNELIACLQKDRRVTVEIKYINK